MYLDDAQTRFMLSAKRIGDAFYISQYEAFPEVGKERKAYKVLWLGMRRIVV